MAEWRRGAVLLCVLVGGMAQAAAQSTSATLSGTVFDAQGRAAPGATITVRSVDTRQLRTTASDEDGRYRLLGLPPGSHAVHVELAGFESQRLGITLTLDLDARIDVTLRPAALREVVTVSGGPTLVEMSKTVLGRTIVQAEIDSLPVPGRIVTNLATLAPGVLANQAGNAQVSTLIVASGQTGRANTFLLDGLSLDDTFQGNVRGGPPLDAVREFVVLAHGFGAEYGQASGAIVSVLTRSGTNTLAGRTSYYHRDDRWNARPVTARLAPSAADEPRFEQRVSGGSVGGPLVRDRVFFFGAIEATQIDTAFIVTTPPFRVYRPNEPTTVPLARRRWQVFGRVDANRSNGAAAMRYRLDRTSAPGTFVNLDSGKNAPESRYDYFLGNQDVGVTDTRTWGRGLNELRVQIARHGFRFDPAAYCVSPCPSFVEDRPGITLGKTVVDSRGSRVQYQVNDAVTWMRRGREGQHVFSAGGEARTIRTRFLGVSNARGSFSFRADAPFDASDTRTFPVFYSQNVGDPDVRPAHTLFALFVQDRWTAGSRVTLNLGARWDYDTLRAVSRDRNNVAPRVGVAISPDRGRRTAIRVSYGVYYDQAPLAIVQEFDQAQQVMQLFVNNPGFPDWRGPNPNRRDLAIAAPTSARRLGDLRTPYTEQATLGLQRSIAGFALSADGIWARGRNLFVTRDLNTPDAIGTRPDPRYQFVRSVESRGRSWYKALAVGLLRRLARGHTVSAAYTLSSAERDTEEFDFTPQDQRDFDAERGPGASDVRHQFVGSGAAELPFRVRAGLVLTARTAAPYNMTTGIDVNRDGSLNDRPPGVGRNSERGAGFVQIDLRVARAFRLGRLRIDAVAEAFNLANRANWTAYDGVQTSTTFGRPVGAAIARQIQLGARVEF